MNNDAGWCGSGGPWITPELSMQKVVWMETSVEGPQRSRQKLPLLPVVAGWIVDGREVSERFLWDWRKTISDLVVENYAGEFRHLAHRHGIRLSIEAYGQVPCDHMAYAGQADEPMAEFWSASEDTRHTCVEMASACACLWQTHSRRRGVHGRRRRKMALSSRHDQEFGRLGLLSRHQSIGDPPLHDATVAQPGARHEHGSVWASLRADADLVGADKTLARVLGPLSTYTATRHVRCRHLLPGAGGRSAVCPATKPRRIRLQLRCLPGRGLVDSHERQGRSNHAARRHELSLAGAALFGHDDSRVVAWDQAAG